MFRKYIPESTPINALYLLSETHGDWYVYQTTLNSDLLTLVIDETGLIVSASFDSSTLFPLNFDIIQVEHELDYQYMLDTPHKYSKGKIIKIK